jgi:streptogramin lyase
MRIGRREFIGSASALAAVMAAPNEMWAQEGGKPPSVPTRPAKVERLFKAPDLHPNALEATPDGLWIGDQVSEKVFKVDWQTGKVLQELQTESHNTSGVAVGAGYLWLGANGGVSGRRPPRPADKPYGEVIQADLKTGKTVKIHPLIWGGGVHGITFVPQTQTLWVTALSIQAVAEVDPKDFRVLRIRPARGDRPHGLDWDNGALWVLIAGDHLVQKIDPESGKVLEIITISRTSDPDPHGMCIHDGYMYYCDAGLTAPGPGSEPAQVCRFRIAASKATSSAPKGE